MKTILLLSVLLTSMPMVSFAHSSEQKNHTTNHFNQWCNDRITILGRAKENAMFSYRAMRYEESISILLQGLTDAHFETPDSYTYALTHMAIARAIVIAEEIQAGTHRKRSYLKTFSHFLFETYDFINKVAERLDMRHYRPHFSGLFRYTSSKDLEKIFLKYSKKQVQLMLHELAGTDREGIVYTVGEPHAFLKGLQMATNFLADDINGSIFATRHACTANELKIISAEIEDLLARPHGGIPYFESVNRYYYEVKYLIEDGCRSFSGPADYGNGFPNNHSHGDYHNFDESQYDEISSRVERVSEDDVPNSIPGDHETYRVLSGPIEVTQQNPFRSIAFPRQENVKGLFIVVDNIGGVGGTASLIVNSAYRTECTAPDDEDPTCIYIYNKPERIESIQLSWQRGKIKVKEVYYTKEVDQSYSQPPESPYPSNDDWW